MGAAFLLVRRFRPFYKWMFRALEQLPGPGPALAVAILDLVQARDPAARVAAAEAASAILAGALRAAGLTGSRDGFLLAHARELQDQLDPVLLGLNPGLDG
jgi:hypothetical protein